MPIGLPLQPGHWSYESIEREWVGPDPYLFNFSGHFGILQGTLLQTLNIYIELHQHAYSAFRRHDDKIEFMLESLKAKNSISEDNVVDEEGEARKMYAQMDHINSLDRDLQRSIRTINRMFVVALWALAEQFLGRIYRELVSFRTGAVPNKVPYRWDDFKVRYLAETINLEKLHDYAIANECRILNNQFKHAEIVSAKLAGFAPYANKTGTRLDDLNVEPQRYLNAVSNFLGSLMENCNKICASEE